MLAADRAGWSVIMPSAIAFLGWEAVGRKEPHTHTFPFLSHP